MKRVYIVTALTSIVVLGLLILCFRLFNLTGGKDSVKVGFIYDNDESTPYTYNFSLAKDALEKKYADMSESELKSHTDILKSRLQNGETGEWDLAGLGAVPWVAVCLVTAAGAAAAAVCFILAARKAKN